MTGYRRLAHVVSSAHVQRDEWSPGLRPEGGRRQSGALSLSWNPVDSTTIAVSPSSASCRSHRLHMRFRRLSENTGTRVHDVGHMKRGAVAQPTDRSPGLESVFRDTEQFHRVAVMVDARHTEEGVPRRDLPWCTRVKRAPLPEGQPAAGGTRPCTFDTFRRTRGSAHGAWRVVRTLRHTHRMLRDRLRPKIGSP